MFSKVLVANRGEIACRVLRACREAELSTVAIVAKNDMSSLFVELADQVAILEGEDITTTYLDGTQIINIALQYGVEAIHPGFGFLSERADFAQAVIDAGMTWIGPSPKAISQMGDKMTARKTMMQAGVPVIPGRDIESDHEEEALQMLEEASHDVGYPLLLKASSGGGGKGMRIVRSPGEFAAAATAARREAQSAFGDARLYIERLLEHAKHVEIQVLADRHGSTIHLGERECSIQRRHQKVFEEAPCATLTDNVREQMGRAAVAAAQAVDYVGAGTVEFMLLPSGEFFFLEMNTRIQVEHPITELVTGVDLVREQLRIAQGLPMSVKELHMRGHAIEVRLYAEDPEQNFLPSIGPLAVFVPPEGPGIRLDTGVRQGDEVTPYYDPMLAKLIVWAPSREEALQRMRRALDDFIVLGTTTNRQFLRELCDIDAVITAQTTTTTIEETWPEGWSPTYQQHIVNAGLLLAEVGETLGWSSSRQTHNQNESHNHDSPFNQINRRFPL